ncbi:MAG: hypothetical protein J0H08_12280, partial [Rhizobiales bacterium]|nr:hypothetical protein [Hyphomicrobiales bacterium]
AEAAAPAPATADAAVSPAAPAAPVRSAPLPPASKPIGGFRLFFLALKGWFRSLFGSRSASL